MWHAVPPLLAVTAMTVKCTVPPLSAVTAMAVKYGTACSATAVSNHGYGSEMTAVALSAQCHCCAESIFIRK